MDLRLPKPPNPAAAENVEEARSMVTEAGDWLDELDRRLTNGFLFPFQGRVNVEADGVVLNLDLGVENGQPVLNRVTMSRAKRMQIYAPDGSDASRGEDGPPLTPSSIQGAVSSEVLNAAIEALARNAAAAGALRARGRRSITDELLREVAEVVRNDPFGQENQAVQREFNYGPRHASRLISAAKKRYPDLFGEGA